MGNANTQYQRGSLRQDIQTSIPSTEYRNRKGSPILVNPKDKHQAFEYMKQLFFHDYSSQQKNNSIFSFRMTSKVSNIVAVKSFQIGQVSYSFPNLEQYSQSGNKIQHRTKMVNLRKAKVYRILTDWICVTLNQLRLQSFSQLFYVVLGVVSAMKELVKYYGLVKITPAMIGVDKEGNVKAWVNQDFSKNQLQNQTVFCACQEQSISNILYLAKHAMDLNGQLKNHQHQFFKTLFTAKTYDIVISKLNHFKNRLNIGIQILNRNYLYQKLNSQILCKEQKNNFKNCEEYKKNDYSTKTFSHQILVTQSKSSGFQSNNKLKYLCSPKANQKFKQRSFQDTYTNTSLNTSIGANINRIDYLNQVKQEKEKKNLRTITQKKSNHKQKTENSIFSCKSKSESSPSDSCHKSKKNEANNHNYYNNIKKRNKEPSLINQRHKDTQKHENLRNTYAYNHSFRNTPKKAKNKQFSMETQIDDSISQTNFYYVTPEQQPSTNFSSNQLKKEIENRIFTREDQKVQLKKYQLSLHIPSFLKKRLTSQEDLKTKKKAMAQSNESFTRMKKIVPIEKCYTSGQNKKKYINCDSNQDKYSANFDTKQNANIKQKRHVHQRFQSFGIGDKIATNQRKQSQQSPIKQSLNKNKGKRVQIIQDVEQFKINQEIDISMHGLVSCQSRYLTTQRNSKVDIQMQQSNKLKKQAQKTQIKQKTKVKASILKNVKKRNSDGATSQEQQKMTQAKKHMQGYKSHKKIDRYEQPDKIKDQMCLPQWQQQNICIPKISTKQFLCVQSEAQFKLDQVNLDDYCNRKLTSVEAQYQSLFLSSEQHQPLSIKNKRISIEDYKMQLKKLQNLHQDVITPDDDSQSNSDRKIKRERQSNQNNKINNKLEESLKQVLEKQKQQKSYQQESAIFSFKHTPNISSFIQQNQLNKIASKDFANNLVTQRPQQVLNQQINTDFQKNQVTKDPLFRKTIQNPLKYPLNRQIGEQKSLKDLLDSKERTQFAKDRSRRNFSDVQQHQKKQPLIIVSKNAQKSHRNRNDKYSNLAVLSLQTQELKTIQETQRDAFSNYQDVKFTRRQSFSPQISVSYQHLRRI